MGLKKIISAVFDGYRDGLCTGVGFPTYLVKKVFSKDYNSLCEVFDRGKYTDPVIKNKVSYQIAKGVGDVVGFFTNASTAFIMGAYIDYTRYNDRKKHEERKKKLEEDLLIESVLTTKKIKELYRKAGGLNPEEPN